MRKLALFGITLAMLLTSIYWSGGAQEDPKKVRLLLVNDQGTSIPGIVRVLAGKDRVPLRLPGALNRMFGLNRQQLQLGWHVVPTDGLLTQFPRGESLSIEALSGLETATTRLLIDPIKKDSGELKIPLTQIFTPEKQGWIAGNTHLHLMKLTKKQADEYLKLVPAADRLKVLFISYLERKPDDKDYITNTYPVGPLKQFAVTGVLVNNGEEHRHNFAAYGQGYGHVMFLDIQKLVQPVSSGPGIMGVGFDDTPLTPGIVNARGQGGTVIWCHNTNGHEDVVNALAGRLHALNVFDGSRTGKYEENYYRYLNIGLRLPISTGTDWFMYDFSRVYARVMGPLTIQSWLEALKAGRCVATNGPFLTLNVEGKGLGDMLELDRARKVKVTAAALGRHPDVQLELVHNGKVIHTAASRRNGEQQRATLDVEVPILSSGWLAVRIASKTSNELDAKLYAHSSPIYVQVGKRRHFDLDEARALLRQLEESHEQIGAAGKFSNPQARARVLALYERSREELTALVNRRGQADEQ